MDFAHEENVNKILDCWEYMLCGRGPGGSNVEKLGVCSVVRDSRFNGVHRGNNAGRACWVVAGSLNKDNIECPYAQKSKNCSACDFYQIVRKEEGDQLLPTIFLIRILEENKK